jgi:signal transduction histidine kinase/PAS domain-containing protein/ActR/RegA family two-component response regulator
MSTKPDFEALFNASPYPYMLMSVPELTIIGANTAYLNSVGRSAADIVGLQIFTAFPLNSEDPDSTNLKELRTSIERAIATKLPDTTPFLRYAVPYETTQGTLFREVYWSTVHTPVLNADGEVAFVAQNAIDVSDLYKVDKEANFHQLRDEPKSRRGLKNFNRAQMHEAMTRILNDERSHLRTLFDQAPGFIAVLRGKSHVFELANEAYYQLVGHRDIIGKPVWQALPEVAGQGFEELLDGVFETGHAFVGRGLRMSVQKEPSGPITESYIDLLYQPIFDASGAVTGIFAQGHDVTETHRAYKELAEKVEQLEKSRARQAFRLQLADTVRHLVSSPDIFMETSQLLGRHLNASRVLFGEYDTQHKVVTYHSNYVDKGVSELNGTYPSASFGAANFASLEDGTTWVADDMEHDPRTAGPDTWPTFEELGIYSAVVVPLSRSGTLIACLFVNDIKARHWTNGEVALIEDAAERAWNAIERIRAEEALRDADRKKDEFLAMLGHELRNPLAPISAAAGLLQLVASNPERVISTSKIIARQVAHMTGIVNDLLDVSRVTSGLVVLEKAEVDIKRVVADAIEQIRPLIESRHHHLNVDTAPGAAYVAGDDKRLVQVLANLLNNAAKYTPEGGYVQLGMSRNEREVLVYVQDDGIGIPKDLLPNIFDLFSQGERSADRALGGLGLGLSLVKSLVELHGGRVEAESNGPGCGSRFTICLPALSSQRSRPAPENASKVWSTTGKALRVLVVDDNKDAATMLCMLLESMGHDVSAVYHPREALERSMHEHYDAYLLDIGLPEIDGNELARRLRAMPLGKNALMVAITGYGQQFDCRNALQAGFDHYFVKPVDPVKLSAVLADSRKK